MANSAAIWIIFCMVCIGLVSNCGISTHSEIVQRALANYDNLAYGSGEILRILREHQGAFQAGAPYPDTFYNTLCKNGDFSGNMNDDFLNFFVQIDDFSNFGNINDNFFPQIDDFSNLGKKLRFFFKI